MAPTPESQTPQSEATSTENPEDKPDRPDWALIEYKAGRPFMFTNVEDLAVKIQSYFDHMDPHIEKGKVVDGEKPNGDLMWADRQFMTKQKKYTMTGLARHLGVSRSTLRNYRHFGHYSKDMNPDEIVGLMHTLEDGIQRVEEFNESQLHVSGISNGVKFNLTNNFGWEDKQTVETKSITEELDNLDDPKTNRDEMAENAHAALASLPAQSVEPPAMEPQDEPGPPPTQ